MIINKAKNKIKMLGLALLAAGLSACTTTDYWVGNGYYGYSTVDTDVYYVATDYSDWNRTYGWGRSYRVNGWGYTYYPVWDGTGWTYYRPVYRRY